MEYRKRFGVYTVFMCLITASQAIAQPESTADSALKRALSISFLRAAATASDLETLNHGRDAAEFRHALAERRPLANCYETETLCPTCETYDMLDWMTIDPDLRAANHMDGSHFMTQVVWSDRIWNLKDSVHIDGVGDNLADTWDVLTYDNEFIYQYITELHWNQPRAYKRAYLNTNIVWAPRVAHGGLPGTRVVSCDTRWVAAVDCVEGNPETLLAYTINEIWGPYTVQTWGNIGTQTIIKVVYFWNCRDSSSTASCDIAETNWYAQRYGLVRWSRFHNDGNGNFIPDQASEFFDVRPGISSPYFPCY